MTVQSTTIICCVHHRRCPPFEEGMRKLYDIGFQHIWIVESGWKKWGPYSGPYERYVDVGYQNIFCSHQNFWKDNRLPDGIERLVLVDNDLWIFDPQDTLDYLQAFIDGGYDLATLSAHKYPRYNTDQIIVPTDFPSVCFTQLHPGAIAYSIFSADLWRRMEPIGEWFNNRNIEFWRPMLDLDPKFGLHRMDKETITPAPEQDGCRTYSQYEKGKWIHFGNLMTSYYNVERDMEVPGPLRRGYFCKYFPDKVKYSPEDRAHYLQVWQSFMSKVL